MTSKLRYMLDTNMVIYTMNGRSEKAFFEMTRHDREEICISSMTYAELCFGAEGSSRREESMKRLEKFLEGIEIVEFGAEAAGEYGRIRQYLKQKGTPIGDHDMLIAAHANSLDLTLVTHNVREFARVPGLEVVDWA